MLPGSVRLQQQDWESNGPESSYCLVLLLCLKDDPNSDEKQAKGDYEGKEKEAGSFLLEERVERTEHHDQDADVADGLAEQTLDLAPIDHWRGRESELRAN